MQCAEYRRSTGQRGKVLCLLAAYWMEMESAFPMLWWKSGRPMPQGVYNHPDDPQQKTVDSACLGLGGWEPGEGICEFETVKPGCVFRV